LSQAFFQSTGVALQPGHRVELVNNGRIFDVIEEEVRAARSSIHILSYIWRPGEPSDRLIRALRERQPGVSCRVLVDPMGSLKLRARGSELSAVGCETRLFRPIQGSIASLDLARMLARTHRKIVVRDGEVGTPEGGASGGAGRETHATRKSGATRNIRCGARRAGDAAGLRGELAGGGRGLPAARVLPALAPAGEARAGSWAARGALPLGWAEDDPGGNGRGPAPAWIANSYSSRPMTSATCSSSRRRRE